MDGLLSALHGQAAFRPAGSMAAPAPPQDFVGAMAQTQDPLSKARRTGSESGACPQGDRHRPKGLVERRRLAHARRHYQSVTGAMGPPELARSDSGPVAALLNRRVRSRTHGGVGGREGRPSLPPDPNAPVAGRGLLVRRPPAGSRLLGDHEFEDRRKLFFPISDGFTSLEETVHTQDRQHRTSLFGSKIQLVSSFSMVFQTDFHRTG